MAFELLPNLIFFAALVGIILLVARRLPQALGEPDSDLDPEERKLWKKGTSIVLARRGIVLGRVLVKKFWHFALDAKGLHPTSAITYRLKAILKKPPRSIIEPSFAQEQLSDEHYFLEQIKKYPNELKHYEELAKLYQHKDNLAEAQTLYEYLTHHDSDNGNYFAKLGFIQMKLRDYDKASKSYERSIELDPTHPSRYYNLSLTYTMLNRLDAARKTMKQALDLNPGNVKYEQALREMGN